MHRNSVILILICLAGSIGGLAAALKLSNEKLKHLFRFSLISPVLQCILYGLAIWIVIKPGPDDTLRRIIFYSLLATLLPHLFWAGASPVLLFNQGRRRLGLLAIGFAILPVPLFIINMMISSAIRN